MASRRKHWVGRVAASALVALAVHVVGYLVVTWLGVLDVLERLPATPMPSAGASANGSATADDDRPIELESLIDELKRPDEKTAEELKREEEAKKEAEDKTPPGQVVDIAKPIIEERPDHSSYVS